MARILSGDEEEVAKYFLEICNNEARRSLCHRKKCGSIIVSDKKIIGRGFNAPPGNKILEKCLKDDLPKDFKSDKYCCIHAEQNAIMDALARFLGRIQGARLYFSRLEKDGKMAYSGKPYCTICSKMAFGVGLREFVLWHEEGITVYETKEYNDLSFAFRE